MKRLFICLGIAALGLGITALPAGEEPKEPKGRKVKLDGYISDSMCGLDHTDMMKKHGGDAEFTEAACINACVKGGAKYVVADRIRKKVYNVDDQKKVAEYAGKKVRIEGRLAEDGTTLEIVEIKLAP